MTNTTKILEIIKQYPQKVKSWGDADADKWLETQCDLLIEEAEKRGYGKGFLDGCKTEEKLPSKLNESVVTTQGKEANYE